MAQVGHFCFLLILGIWGRLVRLRPGPKRSLLSWEGPDWVCQFLPPPTSQSPHARVSGALNILKSPLLSPHISPLVFASIFLSTWSPAPQ